MKTRSEHLGHRGMPGIIGLVSMAIVAVQTVYPFDGRNAHATDARSKVSLAFQKCSTGTRKACVVDGDTIWLDAEKIRIADIDTPEVSEPKCSSELAL